MFLAYLPHAGHLQGSCPCSCPVPESSMVWSVPVWFTVTEVAAVGTRRCCCWTAGPRPSLDMEPNQTRPLSLGTRREREEEGPFFPCASISLEPFFAFPASWVRLLLSLGLSSLPLSGTHQPVARVVGLSLGPGPGPCNAPALPTGPRCAYFYLPLFFFITRVVIGQPRGVMGNRTIKRGIRK